MSEVPAPDRTAPDRTSARDATPSRVDTIDLGLLLIRLMLAVVFFYHGSQKLFGWFGGPGIEGFAGFLENEVGMPMPYAGSIVAACVEFFGALVLVVGTGTRIAGILLFLQMMVASFGVHWPAFDVQENGMEYALTLGVVALALALTGPGRIAAWGRHRREAEPVD